ncbi:hypothetical protein PI125_g10623 [Phytophthora idaei]|nr:hypothetical protein PI125_g10623 [Phytophthora idaei]
MSLTVRWLYTLEDPLVRLCVAGEAGQHTRTCLVCLHMLCFCRVDDGSLTRNTVSCSVHYVDVGMWASFSKSLAVLLRRTLWPGVEPGNGHQPGDLMGLHPVNQPAFEMSLGGYGVQVLNGILDCRRDEEAAIKLKERRGAGRTTYMRRSRQRQPNISKWSRVRTFLDG